MDTGPDGDAARVPEPLDGDVRVCVLGDSFTAGTGDPEHRGWVGRVAAAGPQPVTVYNLGVRRETSADVLGRWRAECTARLPAGVDGRVVVAFGVNDTTAEEGTLRVRPTASAGNLAALLDAAPWPVLVVGPVWMGEVAGGDGAHPGADGYARLAALVAPAWRAWLASPTAGS